MSPDRPSSDPAFLAAYGEVVQQLRRDIGLERKDLSDAAGISYSYLSAIESGQRIPSGAVQNLLARALGVEVSELLASANDHMAATIHEPLMSTPDFPQSVAAPTPRMAGAEAGLFRSAPERRDSVQDPEFGLSPSGALAELRALLPGMSREDAAMVVSMARRLAGGRTSRSYEPRRRGYARSSRRETRTEAYLRFWTLYLAELDRRGLDWAKGRSPEPRSYFTTRSPIKGSSMSASFARNHKLRHELYINRGSRTANIELLTELETRRDIIEDAYGERLDFEDPGQERRAVRLAEYRSGHYSNTEEFEDYVTWFVDRGIRMRRAIEAFQGSS